jgi:hypothetical protein
MAIAAVVLIIVLLDVVLAQHAQPDYVAPSGDIAERDQLIVAPESFLGLVKGYPRCVCSY